MTATQPTSKKQFLEIYRREGSHEQAWAMRLVYEGGSHDIFYMNEPLEVRRPEFEPCPVPDHDFEQLVADFGTAISLWTTGGGSREEAKAKAEAVLARYYARNAQPPSDVYEHAAWVPVHPRQGMLWANAVATLDADHPKSYPVVEVYVRSTPTKQPGQECCYGGPMIESRCVWCRKYVEAASGEGRSHGPERSNPDGRRAHLPDGWELKLCVERGAAWIDLYDKDHESVKFGDWPDHSLAEQINKAVGVALQFEFKTAPEMTAVRSERCDDPDALRCCSCDGGSYTGYLCPPHQAEFDAWLAAKNRGV